MAEGTENCDGVPSSEQDEHSKSFLNRLQLKIRNWVVAQFVQNVASVASGIVGSTVVRFVFWCCTVSVIIWIAVLMYVSFYYAYMPTMTHVRPVYLMFNSHCQNSVERALCSFPEANLSLSTGERTLVRGQRYRVFLDLEMPHSPVNERLGMFMVKVTFLSDSGKVLASSERSGMMHYQSSLLQSFSTIFYSLPMVLGISEEKQTVEITLFEEYMEDTLQPATGANVVVLAKQIEIYSAALRIEAHFVGLRYIMKTWPVISALVAIIINFLIIGSVFFFAYSAFSPEEPFEEAYEFQNTESDAVASEQQRTLCRERSVQGESGIESLDSTTRQPSPGRVSLGNSSASRDLVCGRPSEGMVRCASFPSCRWDMEFQDFHLSSDPTIAQDPYYVYSFSGGTVRRSGQRPYAIGHDGVEDDAALPVLRSGGERGGPGAVAGAHRSRFSWIRVSKDGGMSSGSSTECLHTRAVSQRRRRVKTLSSYHSSDSDNALTKSRHHSHECMECDEFSSNAPLKSRIPDGAASSSEHMHHWAPGSTVDGGRMSAAERSPARTLSDNDRSTTGNKQPGNKTKGLFGWSIRKPWP